MNQEEMLPDEEISLFDVWEKLCDGWRGVAGGVALGVAAAGTVIVLTPARFEAVAVVQVGQVGQVGQDNVSGRPVEPPAEAVERMKSPTFQRRVAQALGDQQWLDDITRAGTGVTKVLSLQMIKGTAEQQVPLIELRASGESSLAALRKAEVTVSELAKVHAELAQPAVARLRADVAIARERLTSAERDLLKLTKLIAATGVRDERFTQIALITSLRIQKEAETYGQRQTIMALETALEPPATQPAHAIEAIFAPEAPASPNKGFLISLGCAGGLLAGLLWVVVRDSWRRTRDARQLSM